MSSSSRDIELSEPERAKLYLDLMDEVRLRVELVARLVEDCEQWRPQFLQEICWLQLRMICETIAIACLLAHGDVKGRNQLDRQKPHEIFTIMKDINPDFFPKPIIVTVKDGHAKVKQRDDRQFMAAKDLEKLWNMAGDRLHRGKSWHVVSQRKDGPTVSLDAITQPTTDLIQLLQRHVICGIGVKNLFLVDMTGSKAGRPVGVPYETTDRTHKRAI